MHPLEPYRSRYRQHLLESVIPFWLNHSLDPQFGGQFTCLDRKGQIYDSRKYVWLNGRAVWTFSKLYNQLEPRPEFLTAARSILEFLRTHATDSKGRVYFSLTREGAPAFYQRKPYAAVFLALGLIEFSKTGAGRVFLDEAIGLFWKIRSWIADVSLLDRPVLAGGLAYSQLADIMVVALLALELAQVDDDPRYNEILRECLRQGLRHYDPARRILLENWNEDSLFAATPEGRFFCPGSSIEVVWFLLHVARHLGGDADAEATLLAALEGSLEFGWDREYGGLYYFMDVEGKPNLQLESNMKLWWPHTEAIYALVLAYSMTGEQRWLDWLARVDAYAFTTFADPVDGEWFGYCSRDGKLALEAKGGNYKGFFHVPRFLLFSLVED